MKIRLSELRRIISEEVEAQLLDEVVALSALNQLVNSLYSDVDMPDSVKKAIVSQLNRVSRMDVLERDATQMIAKNLPRLGGHDPVVDAKELVRPLGLKERHPVRTR